MHIGCWKFGWKPKQKTEKWKCFITNKLTNRETINGRHEKTFVELKINAKLAFLNVKIPNC